MATRHILTDLAGDYESQTGVRVEIRSMGGVEAAKLVRAGRGDGYRRPGVESHGEPGGRGPSRKRRDKGLCAIGDWRCSPRGLGLAQRRG